MLEKKRLSNSRDWTVRKGGFITSHWGVSIDYSHFV